MNTNAEVHRPRKPVFIRAVGAPISQHDRDYIRGRLDKRLHKFDETVERTSVRIEDINGPRGGVDKRCRIKVVLSGLPSVIVEENHYSPRAAVDVALDRIERSIGRAIERRRTN
ncbi:MAG TPA: HPF/RaiA family ribosome-associated protein [Gammaproteobacteria bacterium]|nr:HPF/RaiA family ribosome-associated protein [Gammaproteobacteria bacterium]